MAASSSQSKALLRLDRGRVDVLYQDKTTSFLDIQIEDDGMATLSDWLVERKIRNYDVIISTRCCFVSEFELASSSVTEAATHFAAEETLPVAIEQLAAISFRDETRVVYVAVRKTLLDAVKSLPIKIRWIVPESLLLLGRQVTGRQPTDCIVRSPGMVETIRWHSGLKQWQVYEGDLSTSKNSGATETDSLGDEFELSWTIEEGLRHSQDALRTCSKRLLRRFDFHRVADTLADSEDQQAQRVVMLSQLLFVCGLLLTCLIYYRQSLLTDHEETVHAARQELVSAVFERPDHRISNRRIQSELHLRKQHQELASDRRLKRDPVLSLLAQVLQYISGAPEARLRFIDVIANRSEVVCQFSTEEQCRSFTKRANEAGLEIEIVSQRLMEGLSTLRATLRPVAQEEVL